MSRQLRDSRVATLVSIVGVIAAIAALVPIVSDMLNSDAEVTVLATRTGQDTSPNLVVPVALSDLPRPPLAADGEVFERWLSDNRAVYADAMNVGFLARSEEVAPTIITALRVAVVSREQPLTGTWIVADGAGQQSERLVVADLDLDPPKAVLDGTFTFPLRINNSDAELFTVHAKAKTCYCQWQIELDIIGADNEERTIIIDDDGKPFEISGTSGTADHSFLPRSADESWPKSVP